MDLLFLSPGPTPWRASAAVGESMMAASPGGLAHTRGGDGNGRAPVFSLRARNVNVNEEVSLGTGSFSVFLPVFRQRFSLT